MTTFNFFCPCPRGLEPILGNELYGIGAQNIVIKPGGASFAGDFHMAYKVNLESRVASRVLWEIHSGIYKNEETLYQVALGLPWTEWFDPMLSIRVKITAIHSPLKSLDFTTLRIKDAVCDHFRKHTGKRPNVDTHAPDIRIHVFLEKTNYVMYIDTSGDALYKRGFRKEMVKTPVRENLAAGILILSGWSPEMTLLDPMCGGGTLLIEAGMMALNIAPGLRRRFAFEKLKNFSAQSWNRIKTDAVDRQKLDAEVSIYGSDLYGDVLKIARTNLTAAGLENVVQLKQANILEVSAPTEEGILVTNPPYGERMGEIGDLAEFYPKLGDLLKQKFTGWRAYFFTADMQLPKLIRLATSKRIPLFNGALECRLFEYKMVVGAMRRPKPKNQTTSESDDI